MIFTIDGYALRSDALWDSYLYKCMYNEQGAFFNVIQQNML